MKTFCARATAAVLACVATFGIIKSIDVLARGEATEPVLFAVQPRVEIVAPALRPATDQACWVDLAETVKAVQCL